MGNLKPGATYIYERDKGTVYAREAGSNERQVIGWDHDTEKLLENFHDQRLWADILKEAEFNPTLQQALERVILLYKLSVSKYD